MYQYMWGQALIDRGYNVKYDLTFYEDDGKDMYGMFDRSYTLDKICEIDRVEKAPRWQVNYYKRHYLNKLNQPPEPNCMSLSYEWNQPQYLGKYYSCEPDEYIPFFKKYIHLKSPEKIFDKDNLNLYKQICSCNSVGVHIRRGDMVKATNQWTTPTVDYFVNTICSKEFFGMKFYIFSDEMDWVIENIIPKVKEKVEYYLVQNNGSDKGYMDLLLLSACKHQIASQGSFGVVAFVLNQNPDKILMFPLGSRKIVEKRLVNQNVIYYNLQGKRL